VLSTFVTGTLAGKRTLGRPRCRWEENIRMDLKYIGINTEESVNLAQDMDYWSALVNYSAQDRNYWSSLVNAASNLRVS
jgi:hypothetical protein